MLPWGRPVFSHPSGANYKKKCVMHVKIYGRGNSSPSLIFPLVFSCFCLLLLFFDVSKLKSLMRLANNGASQKLFSNLLFSLIF